MIRLKDLGPGDCVRLAELADNIKIWQMVRDYFPHPYSVKDAETFINMVSLENPRQNFGIEYQGELCGVIGLVLQEDVYKRSAELGYWIGEKFWGKGIATKAVELILKYGFEELQLVRIYSGVFENNPASMKVLEKNGFQKEAIMRKAVFKNAVLMDEHLYSKLNDALL